MTWDQVDRENSYICLSSRWNSAAVEILTGLKQRHDELELSADSTLFQSKGDGLIKNPSKWFAAAPGQGNIKGVTSHTIRHYLR